MTGRRWRIRLSETAESDFVALLHWTLETFGVQQAKTYGDTVRAALSALAEGPEVPGSKSRDEISPGLRSLHIARGGRRGRHFVLYRAQDSDTVEVVRILHDAMDLSRHLPEMDPAP